MKKTIVRLLWVFSVLIYSSVFPGQSSAKLLSLRVENDSNWPGYATQVSVYADGAYSGTLVYGAQDDTWAVQSLEIPDAVRTVRLRFDFDWWCACDGGDGGDLNAYVDWFEIDGQRIEAEDFDRTGFGSIQRPEREWGPIDGVDSIQYDPGAGSWIIVMCHDEDWVEYDIPEGCAGLSDQPVSWWPGDGSALDIRGDNHGTLSGSAGFADGMIGQAFSFNGSPSGLVRIEDASELKPQQFTLDAWVKPYALASSSWNSVISRGASGTDPVFGCCLDSYWLGFYRGKPMFHTAHEQSDPWYSIVGQHDHALSGPDSVSLHVWHHIAASYDGAVKKLYLDGRLVAYAPVQGPVLYESFPVPILIGGDTNNNQPALTFLGQIDEVKIYDRALSDQEVLAVYRAKSEGTCKPINSPPSAGAGPDQTIEVTSCDGASVTLDGSKSYDPDGDELTYTWTENGTVIAMTETAEVTLSQGSHVITLTVDDGKGGTDTDEVVIDVVDTTAPTLDISLDPAVLWPPNHKYVTITPQIAVQDACTESVVVELLSSSSNEPDNGLGDGDRANDIVINDDGSVSLRAERSGKGSGRTYTITYLATDQAGNTGEASGVVAVPHHR